ncbi:hypothetical protein ACMD2_25304 [Ananas comosus]|uniref:BRO1 domain-containing protein n=1 Tax=Ananas comosus TaxID=4615 RepID=A0A199URP0_ANACO|nr:hypothetical protein ACMD2_25304 [Ananas comosus]
MGCLLSTPGDSGGACRMRNPGSIGEVAVFVPGFRIPKGVDFAQSLGDSVPKSLADRIAALRARVVVMVAQETPLSAKPRRRTATRHGGSTLANLLRALEDYLPVLLGLVKDGGRLRDKVRFVWANQEDDAEETVMANAWYEVLSVLHLMSMLCLSQANSMLLPRTAGDSYHQPRVSGGGRRDLPVDLTEGVLRALSLQALGQGVDIQLGMAIDSPKATLAVKRRLACEMAKYWHQAQDYIAQLPLPEGWGKKHQLFVRWKLVEAKAAAYYFHGLILDEGNTEKSHGMAAAALQASEEFLKESKKACAAFNSVPPTSRNPPLWGCMKYLTEKIPKDASSKVRVNRDLYTQERIIETAPTLPDFALALKPDDYQLPQLDPIWNNGISF